MFRGPARPEKRIAPRIDAYGAVSLHYKYKVPFLKTTEEKYNRNLLFFASFCQSLSISILSPLSYSVENSRTNLSSAFHGKFYFHYAYIIAFLSLLYAVKKLQHDNYSQLNTAFPDSRLIIIH